MAREESTNPSLSQLSKQWQASDTKSLNPVKNALNLWVLDLCIWWFGAVFCVSFVFVLLAEHHSSPTNASNLYIWSCVALMNFGILAYLLVFYLTSLGAKNARHFIEAITLLEGILQKNIDEWISVHRDSLYGEAIKHLIALAQCVKSAQEAERKKREVAPWKETNNSWSSTARCKFELQIGLLTRILPTLPKGRRFYYEGPEPTVDKVAVS